MVSLSYLHFTDDRAERAQVCDTQFYIFKYSEITPTILLYTGQGDETLKYILQPTLFSPRPNGICAQRQEDCVTFENSLVYIIPNSQSQDNSVPGKVLTCLASMRILSLIPRTYLKKPGMIMLLTLVQGWQKQADPWGPKWQVPASERLFLKNKTK